MYINMTPDKTNKTLHASQDDTTRQFKFKLVNDSQVLDTSDSIPPVIYDVEPNGIEQLLPVNSSSPTTTPIIADIKYPDELREDQEFVERVTPTTIKGQAKVKKIKGNTLVWNQLVQNGNFENTDNWSGVGVSISASNNVMTLMPQEGSGSTKGLRQVIKTLANHKYLCCYAIKSNVTNQTFVRLYDATSGVLDSASVNTVANTKVYVGVTLEPQSNYSDIRITPINPGAAQLTDVYEISNVILIDLTLLNDSRITDFNSFKQYYPLNFYDYNAGSLLSFNGTGIKTTGKNLLNPQVFNNVGTGSVYQVNDDGSITIKASDGYAWTTMNSLFLKKGTYIFSRSNPNGVCAIRFGYENFATSHLIADQLASYSFTLTQDTDVKIKVGYSYSSYPFTTNVMIRFADTDDTFEPYTENTIDLPISTYFPNGMKSAGTIYDELTESKAITRVGVLNLGSMNWDYITNSRDIPIFVPTGNINARAPGSNNLLCPLYTTIAASSRDGINGDKQLVTYNSSGATKIAISNFDYTDAASFKTAMTGVYLYYELRTPTEEDIESCSLVSEDIEKPLEYNDGFLVCDSDGLTSKAGFIPCKIKKVKGDETLYSQLINLHIERRP